MNPCRRCGYIPPAQRDPGAHLLAKLTPRDLQSIGYLIRAQTNAQIALAFGTTVGVVKNRFKFIYEKTGMSDRLELAIFVLGSPALRWACESAVKQLEEK